MKRTVVTVVAACTVPIATIFLLVRHPPASDVLMVALCLGSIVVSIVAAVWILSDRSPRASAAEPQSPWLDVSADADSVTVVGDASGLEALGAECLRVAPRRRVERVQMPFRIGVRGNDHGVPRSSGSKSMP